MLADRIERQMVDPAVHTRQLNRARERQGLLCGQQRHRDDGGNEHDQGAHETSPDDYAAGRVAPTSTSSAYRNPLARSVAVPWPQTRTKMDCGRSATR